MQEISCNYNPEEWRLFIHFRKISLKAALLYRMKNLNTCSHVTGFQENIPKELLLRLTKYKKIITGAPVVI